MPTPLLIFRLYALTKRFSIQVKNKHHSEPKPVAMLNIESPSNLVEWFPCRPGIALEYFDLGHPASEGDPENCLIAEYISPCRAAFEQQHISKCQIRLDARTVRSGSFFCRTYMAALVLVRLRCTNYALFGRTRLL